MTTRREFFKHAGAAMMFGAFGFPALVRGQTSAKTDAVTAGLVPTGATPASVQASSAVATNGYLASLLPLEDQVALRQINVSLTQLAIEQSALLQVANQIVFDTLIPEALADFALHGVLPDELVQISQNYDVVFVWS